MKNLLYTIILLLFVLSACDDRPKDVLSRSDMEDVLYDYHLAQGLIEQLPDSEREKMSQEYINAVFMKHNITELQFDSSIIYYNRHTKDLSKIYDNLKERLADATDAIQLENGNNDMAAVFAGGDTVNIWNTSPMFLLRPKELLCTESFSIVSDTAFHQHDEFIFTFSPVFMNEDQDDRSSVLHVGLSVIYKNGKTTSQTRQFSTIGKQQFSVKAAEDVDINKITGFFFYKGKETGRNYCVVSNISLVCMHTEKNEVPKEEKKDSVNVDSVKTDTAKPEVIERRLTPDEVRRENQTGNKLNIQSAPSVRTPNSYGPRRRNVGAGRGKN